MKKVILMLALASAVIACDDKFDINRSPDYPSADSVTMDVELPAGTVGIIAAEGSYYSIIGGFWSQFWTQSNLANQYKSIDNYSITTNDFTAAWAAMYDALGDIRNVKKLAESQENWNYYLAATVLEVQASQVIADFYDQIPYAQANNQDILQPIFNTGQETYDLMIADLQEALSKDFNASQGNPPGADDVIFGGDMNNWKAFANSLLLKLYLRQTEANPTAAQQGITALFNSGAEFLDTDAAMSSFEDAPNRSNPLYESDRRQLNVGTNLRASTTLYSFLDTNSDPRLDAYYGPGGPLDQGDFTSSAGNISVVILAPTTPAYLMSREESLLLQAEALERYFGGTGAKELYDAAVSENFSKYSLSGDSFVAAGGAYEYPSTGTFDQKLEAIITQKWVSSFPGNGFESFFEQNRTGYPLISDVEQSDEAYVPGQWSYSVNGITGGLFPKRLQYPNTVATRNANTPGLEDITTPVWWDVN